MDLIDDPDDDGATVSAGLTHETFRLRSYQAEMVEESLKANIIVAMDTGSGKTHIALARTAAELERCDPNKLVWFLAPTVTLCDQQFEVFKTNLPGYGIQVLSGRDDVDHWTDQNVWDAVLHNVRIVVSTHQVLLDALTHAFVKMSRLALIIFDEAHYCIKNHPASQIMVNFYMPLVQEDCEIQLPRVLGLTASPVMKGNATISDLQQLEEKLNATAKTPKVHRSELLRFVHRPQLLRVDYPGIVPTLSRPLAALRRESVDYDFESDPYLQDLLARQRDGYDTSRQVQRVYLNNNTYCYKELKTLYTKCMAMAQELGPSVAEWYLAQCILRFEAMVRGAGDQLLEWSVEEKQHLLDVLRRLPSPEYLQTSSVSLDRISPKVDTLINLLAAQACPDFTGLVFVEQRVWVAALADILSTDPRTKDLFKIGTFVGTSQSSKRKVSIANLVEPRNQEATLEHFRQGEKNLILTTSVLEEGIDVSSCHLVICFESPKTLKSFIQRRGRARKQESKYFVFLPEFGSTQLPESWESLEEKMKQAYLDDLRQVKQAEERELEEEDGKRYYRVQSTGALLTFDNASPHLHHFCALLGSGPYVDPRPQYKFEELELEQITAEVVLPISVDPSVRTARSLESWRTERMARKDAAFEAYKGLHLAGLVNDNLLPAREEVDDQAAEFQMPDTMASLVEVSPTFDPWVSVARHLQQNHHSYYRTLLSVKSPGQGPFHMILLTPVQMPTVSEFTLYWNETRRFFVEGSWLPGAVLGEDEINIMRSITRSLLISVFHGRMQEERYDFPWFFIPSDPEQPIWSQARLQDWVTSTNGTRLASAILQEGRHDISEWGLVSIQGDMRKFMPKGISEKSLEPQLQLTRAPKRRDFLHPISDLSHETEAYTRTEERSASQCVVDNLPAAYSVFALFIPSILHRYEIFMTAETLRTTILAPLSLGSVHLHLIVRALTSSATGEQDNYQRLEFLGDCILKLISSVHLMADKLTWPESYLTGKKGKIVSNGFLARATLSAGLDRFIITKRFTGAKWAPRYVGDLLSEDPEEGRRTRSSKLLADVIESLIGASYIIGGFSNAFICVQTLLPLEKWTPIPEANNVLFRAAPTDIEITSLSTLETLIGHTFHKKMLLLEALTHPSYNGPNASSYERLEFLGDAVLDYIISKRLYAHTPELSHQKMHSMRAAMANAAFLAFRMFETAISEERTNPSTMQKVQQQRCLWQFLRYSDHNLPKSRDLAVQQHEAAREQILGALQNDNKFPWHLLSLTDAPKFLSDIVESVIGGIYIDSQGDIPTCEIFVRRLGILGALERILTDEVDCLHPKERLGHLAVEKDVQYVRIREEDEKGKGQGKKMYKVQVQVGGEDVGGVTEGLKRLNAETIAAWNAVRIIEGIDDVEMSQDEWYDAEDGGVLLDAEY